MCDDIGSVPTPAGEPIPASAPDLTVDQEQPAPSPDKTFTQAELDDIVEKRLSRERRKLEKLERQHEIEAEVQRRLAVTQAEQNKSPNEAPKREDFESYEDFLEAKADWKVDKALRERDARDEDRELERQTEQRRRQQAQTFEERTAKATETYPDYEEVVIRNDDLAITPVMAEAIKATESGIDVAYHLGKNPEEAQRIARLDPYSQVFELGRIAARLEKPEKPVSKAAAPISAVSGGRSSTRGDIYEPGISMAEYKRRREASQKQAG